VAKPGYSTACPVRRRLLLAVGLSLALHALVFVLLSRLGQAPLPSSPRPLVVEVLQRPVRRVPHPPAVKPPPQGPAHGAQPAPGLKAAGPAVRTAGPGLPDAPRVPLDLFPQGALEAAAPPEPEAPDAGSPAEILTARVQTWRLDGLAEHRVSMGVDTYFSTLGHALRDKLGEPPPPAFGHDSPSTGQRMLQSWLQNLAQADKPEKEAPPTERGPTQTQYDLGGRESDMVHQLLGPMAPTFDSLVAPVALVQRALGQSTPPAAVLRLVQDAQGHLKSVELVASSGDARFDAWAKRSVALALAAVPKPPEHGTGLHPDGTRSDWAFYRTGDGVAVLLLRVY
jgi:TonB C terminal